MHLHKDKHSHHASLSVSARKDRASAAGGIQVFEGLNEEAFFQALMGDGDAADPPAVEETTKVPGACCASEGQDTHDLKVW